MHSGRVTTEGDDLYFEVRGHGQTLLMIPGGGGDGNAYAAVAGRLSDEFKVVTYDRRACARSTMNHPEHFCIAQQSRDAIVVLQAAGETSALIFGNSSGAVIALDMAKTQPEAVAAIVAHEPPLARMHPDSAKWQSFFQSVRAVRRRFGSRSAILKFALGIGVDVSFMAAFRAFRAARKAQAESPQPYLDRRKVLDFFLGQEMLPVTNYMPDLNALRRIKDKVFLAAGHVSLGKKRFFAEVAPILAEQIGCEMVVFPGHHASFVDLSDEWAARLRDTLHRASRARLSAEPP
jgi:pimeloyl-ACP methyl ester carboxylesterase